MAGQVAPLIRPAHLQTIKRYISTVKPRGPGHAACQTLDSESGTPCIRVRYTYPNTRPTLARNASHAQNQAVKLMREIYRKCLITGAIKKLNF